MNRFVVVLFALAVLASAVKADIPPPAPPIGKKYVSVDHEVVLSKEVPGYVFVVQSNFGPGRPIITHHKLELPVGKAVAIDVGGKHGSSLYAIPEATAREFKTDQELFDALKKGTVPGVQRIGFGATATVSRRVLGNSVKWTHTITSIDANGIHTKVEGKGYEPPESPEKNDKLHARGWPCATFGALSLAMLFGGLWRVSRNRRAV
jgi:hypothetical protein